VQCESIAETEEWCKCLSLQDVKVKLDDFELLTVIGQVCVRACVCLSICMFGSPHTYCNTTGIIWKGCARTQEGHFRPVRDEDPEEGPSEGDRPGDTYPLITTEYLY
jgi:hypothetical protein